MKKFSFPRQITFGWTTFARTLDVSKLDDMRWRHFEALDTRVSLTDWRPAPTAILSSRRRTGTDSELFRCIQSGIGPGGIRKKEQKGHQINSDQQRTQMSPLERQLA